VEIETEEKKKYKRGSSKDILNMLGWYQYKATALAQA
jgi:hypothetical protein